MSFYNDLHNLYNGSVEPIIGPIDDPISEVNEPDFPEDSTDCEEQFALMQAKRAEEEHEDMRRHMQELERRYQQNQKARAIQNAAIIGGAFWLLS